MACEHHFQEIEGCWGCVKCGSEMVHDEPAKAEQGAHELLSALAALEQFWGRPGENSIETFERVAEWFHRETGYLRPGKDCRLHDPEFREQVWRKWRAEKLDKARAAIARATAATSENV